MTRFPITHDNSCCTYAIHELKSISVQIHWWRNLKVLQQASKAKLYALAFSGLKLRNAYSLMTRVTDIDQKGIDNLEKSCREYFICSSPFSTGVTPSMWTVCLCAPYHSRSFSAFQVGLGINTMQGREAKHQKLATYAQFSLPKERWEKMFLHEHMSLISGLRNKTHIW